MAHIEELAKDTFKLSATGRATIWCKGYTKSEVMKKYPEYFGQLPEQKLAERLFALVPWWDQNGETVADIVTQLEQNPLDIIAWLLDYIEESED